MCSGVPQADLPVIPTGEELGLQWMNSQTPQFISMSLERRQEERGDIFIFGHCVNQRSLALNYKIVLSCPDFITKTRSFISGKIPTYSNMFALTCVIGTNSPSKLPRRTKFLVVPIITVSPLPSAIVLMGPNSSGTCGHKTVVV